MVFRVVHDVEIERNKPMLKKKETQSQVFEKPKEKNAPAFLRDDYPYRASGDSIEDLESLEPTFIYEIKCNLCEMSIRSQGVNIIGSYERLKESGCIGCGNKSLVIKKIDMSEVSVS